MGLSVGCEKEGHLTASSSCTWTGDVTEMARSWGPHGRGEGGHQESALIM